MQTRWKRSCPASLRFTSLQRHNHHMGTLSQLCPGLSLEDLHLEWSKLYTPSMRAPPMPSEIAVLRGLSKLDVLTIVQGVESLFISLSLMTLMILPRVHIPITRGMHQEKSDSSATTKKMTSSS